MRKSELEVALDNHLRSNQTTYQNDPSLGDYYKRLEPTSEHKFGEVRSSRKEGCSKEIKEC